MDCLLSGNQSWALNANVPILSTVQKYFSRYGKYNRHYIHDVGAANTKLLLQATDMDVYGHMMIGFDMPNLYFVNNFICEILFKKWNIFNNI
ncbi:hypothetical protein ACFL0J_05255 [Candidatus Neomarinimicrobiota bacterium]